MTFDVFEGFQRCDRFYSLLFRSVASSGNTNTPALFIACKVNGPHECYACATTSTKESDPLLKVSILKHHENTSLLMWTYAQRVSCKH